MLKCVDERFNTFIYTAKLGSLKLSAFHYTSVALKYIYFSINIQLKDTVSASPAFVATENPRIDKIFNL